MILFYEVFNYLTFAVISGWVHISYSSPLILLTLVQDVASVVVPQLSLS